jgi:hypothetical protein
MIRTRVSMTVLLSYRCWMPESHDGNVLRSAPEQEKDIVPRIMLHADGGGRWPQ